MVKQSRYVPDRGDIVWIDFKPTRGHEQSGRRPAIVLSPGKYNKKTGLFIVCPITSKEKGHPFEVRMSDDCKVKGVALSDHIKNLDWKARKARFICTADVKVVKEIQNKSMLLITK